MDAPAAAAAGTGTGTGAPQPGTRPSLEASDDPDAFQVTVRTLTKSFVVSLLKKTSLSAFVDVLRARSELSSDLAAPPGKAGAGKRVRVIHLGKVLAPTDVLDEVVPNGGTVHVVISEAAAATPPQSQQQAQPTSPEADQTNRMFHPSEIEERDALFARRLAMLEERGFVVSGNDEEDNAAELMDSSDDDHDGGGLDNDNEDEDEEEEEEDVEGGRARTRVRPSDAAEDDVESRLATHRSRPRRLGMRGGNAFAATPAVSMNNNNSNTPTAARNGRRAGALPGGINYVEGDAIDCLWGFCLGFLIGPLVLFWSFEAVPMRQRLGLLVGIAVRTLTSSVRVSDDLDLMEREEAAAVVGLGSGLNPAGAGSLDASADAPLDASLDPAAADVDVVVAAM